jgi:hypothetical protein
VIGHREVHWRIESAAAAHHLVRDDGLERLVSRTEELDAHGGVTFFIDPAAGAREDRGAAFGRAQFDDGAGNVALFFLAHDLRTGPIEKSRQKILDLDRSAEDGRVAVPRFEWSHALGRNERRTGKGVPFGLQKQSFAFSLRRKEQLIEALRSALRQRAPFHLDLKHRLALRAAMFHPQTSIKRPGRARGFHAGDELAGRKRLRLSQAEDRH